MQIKGKSASSGIAVAKALVIKHEPLVIERFSIREPETEIESLHAAIATSKQAIDLVRQHALESLGPDKAAIFEAHMLLLEDPELVGETENLIKSKNINAAAAFKEVSQNFISIFEGMDNEYMRERAADIRDISDRVLRTLNGIPVADLSTLKDEVILVCHDLSPSETATLNPAKVLGMLTNIGGKTSHTAIVARTKEIPAVLGLKNVTDLVKTGEWVAFDGETGVVEVNPSEAIRKNYSEARKNYLKDKAELQNFIGRPNQTKDGRKAQLVGNIGSPQDIGILKKYDAAGVGLYRTELLFMEHSKMPSEEEQFVAYKAVLEAMGDKPVTIRTLDIGGDKALPYMDIGEEENPFLGYRAIRYCFDHPEIFKTQLRALLRASFFGNLKIMFPMISSLDELLRAKKVVAEVREELNAQKVPVKDNIPLGVMIEIPSAALVADHLAANCEFLSIGTNDLIQYSVAVDRMNERVQNLYDPFHPGVLRLIKMVIDHAHRFGKKVSMCGEMGGSPLHIPLLVGLGLDEFSMAPTSILRSRRLLSEWTQNETEELARVVLEKLSSVEIEALLNEAHNKKRNAAI